MTPKIITITKHNVLQLLLFIFKASVYNPLVLLFAVVYFVAIGSLLSPDTEITKVTTILITMYIIAIAQPVLSLAGCFRYTLQKSMVECVRVFNSSGFSISRLGAYVTMIGVPIVVVVSILSYLVGGKPITLGIESSFYTDLFLSLILGYFNATAWSELICKLVVRWSYPNLSHIECAYFVRQGIDQNPNAFRWLHIVIAVVYSIGYQISGIAILLVLCYCTHLIILFGYYIYVSGQYPRTRVKQSVLKPIESM